jgi:MFS family permease
LPRIFYGWYVVAAIFLVQTTGAGLCFYNLSVLLDAFVVERGFPVAQASFATASFFVASGIAGVIAGRLIDRFDPRFVIAASGCLSALALGCVGLLRETWQLYVFYVALGFSYGGCGLVPGATIVTRWFHARRALAISIASTGLSLGGVLLTPLSAFAIRKLGLAGAAPWLAAAFFLGVVPVTLLLVRASPHAMGLLPDGATRREGEAAPQAAYSASFSEARRSGFFIGVTAAYVFALGAQVGAIAHVFRLASTRVDAHTAALAVALIASSSLIGRLAGGWLLVAKAPARAFALTLIVMQAAALAVLALASAKGVLLLGAVLFGLAVGNVLMMQSLLLAEAFGTREYGRIYSTSQFFTVIGVASGPALVGLLFETSGNYTIPYLSTAAASLVGFTILLLAGPARTRA